MLTHLARVGFVAFAALAIFAASLEASDGAPAGGPAFEMGTLGLEIGEPTSLAFGPDGRLYASSQTEIIAISLDHATHEVLAIEQIASGLNGILGLAFDHTAPPNAPITLYASRQDPSGVPGYLGRVSAFTAPNWARQDVISDLPSSAPLLNHMTNGLAFDDAGRLFIAQGSNTDAGLIGEPSPTYYPESPLSAAILVADVNNPGFDGDLIYNPPGQPIDYNVDLVRGDVEVYAPGLRNPYDLVIHSNGHIYATDNGAIGYDGAASCTGDTVETSVSDELNLIEEGNYYGFPNLNRGRFDPRQCVYHAPEEGSGADFIGPIRILPRHCSCDGMVEYVGPAMDGAMNGDLIIAQYVRGDIMRVELSDDGQSVEAVSTIAEGFDMPLDVTVGPDGTIYVAVFDDNIISYLAPVHSATTPTPAASDTATSTPTPTPDGPRGDANCSGGTNSIDAALVLQYVAGLVAEVGCPDRADVDGDGGIDAIDAALILQIDAGLF